MKKLRQGRHGPAFFVVRSAGRTCVEATPASPLQ